MAAILKIDDIKPYEFLFIKRHRQKLNQEKMGRKLRLTRRDYSLLELGILPPEFFEKDIIDFYVKEVALTGVEKCILLRKRCGWDQSQLAKELGVSRLWINCMENARRNSARLIEYWRS